MLKDPTWCIAFYWLLIFLFTDQLYEAQKHMDIEKLDKSLSYQSLESARQLAEEMKQQASDHAKAAGHERGLEFLI